MASIRGVILDVDGTLVASNDAHAHAWVEALAEQGIAVPFAKVRRLIGMGGDKLLPRVCDLEEDTPAGKKITARRKEIFQQKYLPHLQPTPGAPELLRQLRDRGLKLAVASSAKKEELNDLLRICQATGLIEEKTSTDDAEHSKPDPDIVHATLQKVEMRPDQAVMLGDTPYDLDSAGRAGVGLIAVRCGGWSDNDLRGALAIYDDPADLLAHIDSSPLANRQ